MKEMGSVKMALWRTEVRRTEEMAVKQKTSVVEKSLRELLGFRPRYARKPRNAPGHRYGRRFRRAFLGRGVIGWRTGTYAGRGFVLSILLIGFDRDVHVDVLRRHLGPCPASRRGLKARSLLRIRDPTERPLTRRRGAIKWPVGGSTLFVLSLHVGGPGRRKVSDSRLTLQSSELVVGCRDFSGRCLDDRFWFLRRLILSWKDQLGLCLEDSVLGNDAGEAARVGHAGWFWKYLF